MIALQCLAASLLMASAVGSGMLAPPQSVAVLPAVSYARVSSSYGDSLVPVSPLADSDEDVAVDVGDFDVPEIVVNFAGSTITFSEVNASSYISLSYSSSLTGYTDEYAPASLSHLIFVLVNVLEESDLQLVTVDLPDLSYWDFDVDRYSISVFVEVAANDFRAPVSYLGLYDADELLPIEFADLGEDVNPVTAIADGLTAVVPLGGALTDGFDAVFMDDGAITAIGSFAFILMGIGIAVGITKKCFNWVTGRHGM